jgi:UDP-glucose:glycoprotein glucosyltransferase
MLTLYRRILDLPFDRIMGDKQSKTPAILYADLMSPSFRQFHKTISQTAKSGKTSYRLRYRPSLSIPGFPLAVSGYGIALDLKRTDYIVIDDRKADESDDTNNDASTAKLTDEDVADLKPLSSKELLRLDMKASSFIMESANPFDTLLKLTQDFPKHSAAMSTHEVSELFRKEHLANREIFLPSGYNVIWVNGLQVLARDFDAYAMLEHLRRERKLINSAGELGLSGKEAVRLLSHSSISEAASTQEPQRYDWRDELEGGRVIIWMNDIENDRRYAEWPTQVRAVSRNLSQCMDNTNDQSCCNEHTLDNYLRFAKRFTILFSQSTLPTTRTWRWSLKACKASCRGRSQFDLVLYPRYLVLHPWIRPFITCSTPTVLVLP